MNAIWKYEIPLTEMPFVQMPKGARMLHAGEQGGKLFVWAAVDPVAELVPHRFTVAGTGHEVHMPLASMHVFHVGTVQMASGLVWHVFHAGIIDVAGN